jgi:hypothetical protein
MCVCVRVRKQRNVKYILSWGSELVNAGCLDSSHACDYPQNAHLFAEEPYNAQCESVMQAPSSATYFVSDLQITHMNVHTCHVYATFTLNQSPITYGSKIQTRVYTSNYTACPISARP